jgi:hypothetical protein
MGAIKILAPTRRSLLPTTLAAGAFGVDMHDARRRPTSRRCENGEITMTNHGSAQKLTGHSER